MGVVDRHGELIHMAVLDPNDPNKLTHRPGYGEEITTQTVDEGLDIYLTTRSGANVVYLAPNNQPRGTWSVARLKEKLGPRKWMG